MRPADNPHLQRFPAEAFRIATVYLSARQAGARLTFAEAMDGSAALLAIWPWWPLVLRLHGAHDDPAERAAIQAEGSDAR